MEDIIVIEDDDMEFEDFARGQCVYKCRICDRKYFDSLDFWSHDCLEGLPGRIAEYKREHTHYLKRRFHTCRVVPGCGGQTMDWDRSIITSHLHKVHASLPMRRYYEDYIKKVNAHENLP